MRTIRSTVSTLLRPLLSCLRSHRVVLGESPHHRCFLVVHTLRGSGATLHGGIGCDITRRSDKEAPAESR